MVKAAWLVASKDIRLVLTRGGGLVQAFLLGLLLIFVFSLSQQAGARVPPQTAAAIFWLASAFCQVLAFNMLYALEEQNQARAGLLLMPASILAVWMGKSFAGFVLLFASQALFVPAMVVFLGQQVGEQWPLALTALVLVDVGMAAIGSLLGAVSRGQNARESLLSIVLFPLVIPLLLAGIRLGAVAFAEDLPEGAPSWLGLIAAFDAVFLGAGLVLFPFLFGDE